MVQKAVRLGNGCNARCLWFFVASQLVNKILFLSQKMQQQAQPTYCELLLLAASSSYEMNSSMAQFYYNKAIQQRLQQDEECVEALLKQACMFWDLGLLDKVKTCCSMAMQQCEQHDLPVYMQIFQGLLCEIGVQRGESKLEATRHYEEAIQLCEKVCIENYFILHHLECTSMVLFGIHRYGTKKI